MGGGGLGGAATPGTAHQGESSRRAEGPGQWARVSEAMSRRAASYQAKITGRPGWVYKVNGVKFDGYSNGVLQEAKGPGYASFVKDGKFQRWFHGRAGLVDQGQRQEGAAGGRPITWSVAEEPAAHAIEDLFDQANIVGIDVVHVPAGEL